MGIDQSPEMLLFQAWYGPNLKSGVSLMERKGRHRILCRTRLLCVPPDLSALSVLFQFMKQEIQGTMLSKLTVVVKSNFSKLNSSMERRTARFHEVVFLPNWVYMLLIYFCQVCFAG